MKKRSSKSRYIQIDTKKCQACWKCIDACKHNVIGRINMPWHKHTKIVNGDMCTGCLACIRVCDFNAIINLKNF